MTVLRSMLFVPGNRPKMLEKALGSRPDAFVPDLEDSVPADEKANARSLTASYLERLAATGRPVIPRVNSKDTGLLEEDLAAVVGGHVFGVSVGKIDSPAEVHEVARLLQRLELRAGLAIGAIKLVPLIESARAVVNVYDICASSDRIVGVALGGEDYANDMEIERREDDRELAYPRSAIAIAAKAAGILALDTPFLAFRDANGLRENSRASRGYGFRGRFAIHPAQIEVINQAYSPSEAEVEHAKRVIAAFETAAQQGRGSTSLDGKVVDVPVVKRAQALLDLAMGMRSQAD